MKFRENEVPPTEREGELSLFLSQQMNIVQSTLGCETLDKAAALGLATATPLTDLRQYINSDLGFSNLKMCFLPAAQRHGQVVLKGMEDRGVNQLFQLFCSFNLYKKIFRDTFCVVQIILTFFQIFEYFSNFVTIFLDFKIFCFFWKFLTMPLQGWSSYLD